MLRGAQKQMIVVRTRDSRLFEEAYFVMRRGAGRQEEDRMDMLFEANRILENSLPRPAETAHEPSFERGYSENVAVGRTRRRAPLVWFSLGAGAGGSLVALVWGLVGLIG